MLVTEKLTAADVETSPFPYVIARDVLPAGLSQALLKALPPLERISGGARIDSNVRLNFSAEDLLADPEVSLIWKEIVSDHVQQRFLDQVVSVFSPSIQRLHPDFADRYAKPEELRASLRTAEARKPDSFDQIALDAQIAINTPVQRPGPTVRGPHLDDPRKLFVGLLYLRSAEDRSEGGELELYEPCDAEPVFQPKRLLRRDQVRTVRRIPYRDNCLFLFLNTLHALHGVTERSLAPHPRCFLNLVGVLRKPIFQVPIETDEAGR